MAQRTGVLTRLKELLFPPRCAGCGALLDFTALGATVALCKTCAPQWESEKQEPCGHCFLPVSECSCMTELIERGGCDAFYKLVYYLHGKGASVQNKVVYRIKNTRDRRTPCFLAGELAPTLAARMETDGLDAENTVLAYIPRRRNAYRENGTDQARELARALSVKLNVPVCHCLVRKAGKETEQKRLTPIGRWRNARSSYAVRANVSVKGKHVLLVDDIVTTGASMAACAQKLLKAGAASVSCVAVASDDGNKYPSVPPLSGKENFAPMR